MTQPDTVAPPALTTLPDDRLGSVAVSLTVAELQWTPDVAPAVMDRLSRDAIAYPEQFDRRSRTSRAPNALAPSERSAKRTMGRLAVFGVVLALISAFVVFIASASLADAENATAGSAGASGSVAPLDAGRTT